MKNIIFLILFIPVLVFGQQQTINIGTSANDHTGDPLRTAFQKTNANFTELYGQVVVSASASGPDTYVTTPDPPTAFVHGRKLLITFQDENTGPSTLNPNGLGARDIKKFVSGSLADLDAGDIPDGSIWLLTYDGTNAVYQISIPEGGGGSGTVESVTGDGVDNTDPDNPVLIFPVASEVDNTPSGTIASTNVQNAINEIDNEKQPQLNGTGYVKFSGTTASFNSTIPNGDLANSSITVAGNSTALGGSVAQDQITGLASTGIVKRTGSNTLAIATSGTDYAPATSGSAILKGNGSGGFSSAVDGTDYLSPSTLPKVYSFAFSDEITTLTTGTAKITFSMPYAMTVTNIYCSIKTAQTSGSVLTLDINESGSTILSTKITFDNNETDSYTAATPPVISDSSLAFRSVITLDIDQVGTGPVGGKCDIIGY